MIEQNPGPLSPNTPIQFKHHATVIGLSTLTYELLLCGTALLIAAVQWLLIGRGSWLSTLIYTVVSGNVVSIGMATASPWYIRPFPQNWLRYLFLLLPVAALASLLGGVTSRLLLHRSLASLADWQRGDLPYAALISYVIGVVMFAFISNRMRLEEEKEVLVQRLQRGEAALETHAAELQAAFEIQSNLLPKTIPQIPGVEISCAWQPARTVSGDYFDVLILAPGRIGFCLADVSGKGMGAALVTANLQAAFRAFAPTESSPARVCERLNEALCASLPLGKFVTLVYGIVDRPRMQLTYELAGHNPPILLRNGAAQPLEGTGPVLGLLPAATFTDHVLQLAPGDRLLIPTDGILEACPPDTEEEFGEDRLVAAALHAPTKTVHAMQAEIMRQVDAFAQGQFADDASLIVLGITPSEDNKS